MEGTTGDEIRAGFFQVHLLIDYIDNIDATKQSLNEIRGNHHRIIKDKRAQMARTSRHFPFEVSRSASAGIDTHRGLKIGGRVIPFLTTAVSQGTFD